MTVRYNTKFIWLYRILPCLALGLFIVITPLTAPPEITTGSWVFAAFGLPSLGLGLSYLREAVQRFPRLEITENGLEDRALGVGFIPWHDIKFLTSWKMKDSGEGVRLHMDADVRLTYLRECSRLRRIGNRMNSLFTGTGGLAINTHGYDRNPKEIVDYMRDCHARAVDPAERLTD